MSFETALRTRLLNDGTVGAIVGTVSGRKSIDWNERPEGAPFPAVVLDAAYTERSQHMSGFDTFVQTRTQFRCTARKRADAVALREAVITAITPEATQSSIEFLRAQDITHFPRVENTDAGTLHHEIVEAFIWHADVST